MRNGLTRFVSSAVATGMLFYSPIYSQENFQASQFPNNPLYEARLSEEEFNIQRRSELDDLVRTIEIPVDINTFELLYTMRIFSAARNTSNPDYVELYLTREFDAIPGAQPIAAVSKHVGGCELRLGRKMASPVSKSFNYAVSDSPLCIEALVDLAIKSDFLDRFDAFLNQQR